MAADSTTAATSRVERSRIDGRTLARLTGAKTVVNVALRWIPPFLPTLGRAFGATTTQLTTVIGLGEVAGLSTMFVGRHLDLRRERLVMIASLGLVATSAALALIGTFATFAISFFALVLGVANFTVAGHTWISHRVDYRSRARSIGLFETSWAVALLAGAPIAALLINAVGWRGPFIAVIIGCLLATALVATSLPASPPTEGARTAARRTSPTANGPDIGGPARRAHIPLRAWLVMVGSATTAMAGLSVFVISGSWLHDAFGVSTGGVGLAAMTFGATEMIASLGSALFADRAGKMRTTLAGLVCLLAGLVVMVLADDRLPVGVGGVILLLFGFELAFVTSLSLVSECMPRARGAALAANNAVGTLARSSGIILGGWLYGIHGISGTASLAAVGALVAAGCLLVSRRLPAED